MEAGVCRIPSLCARPIFNGSAAEKDDMIRIAAVDDDQLVRTGTRGLLEEAARNKFIAEAGGGEKVADLARKLKHR